MEMETILYIYIAINSFVLGYNIKSFELKWDNWKDYLFNTIVIIFLLFMALIFLIIIDLIEFAFVDKSSIVGSNIFVTLEKVFEKVKQFFKINK